MKWDSLIPTTLRIRKQYIYRTLNRSFDEVDELRISTLMRPIRATFCSKRYKVEPYKVTDTLAKLAKHTRRTI